ncbi:Nucleotide-binding oligomerization domain-containing protein 2 [Holothuria leucospilota]|uniref:Nucleotide-binding oligomerization domain-containing protein 2 n=1 Tax=Holothuria leucospilota TaxID=206669 RepID=A0A9Q0YK09_HOLLE|nr:Nucleotide-binding oligomerization domain-containing protein 2 [Holothuria leucospilota]
MGSLAVIFIWMIYSSLGDVLEGCQSPQYLQFRKVGIIHCNLNDTFSAVFWYDSTNIFDDEPVVTFTHSIKGGQGYKSGEFDITPEGSLVILDVGLNHEKNFTMARFASLDENPSTSTVSVVVTGITTDGCDSPQYLEYGRSGIVHCYFQTAFESVFWYNSTQVLSDPPIVTYGQSAKGGRAYELGEFDVFPNGSLLINEVGLAHENNFTVAIFTSLNEDPVYILVRVIVTVKYLGGGPVIENCDGANTTCYVEMEGVTAVSCIVQGVRPAVSLKWFTLTCSGYRNISSDVDIISNNLTFTSVAVTADAFAYSPVLSLLVCKAEFAPGVLQRDKSLVLVQNSERNLSFVPHAIKYAVRGSTLELKCSAAKILFLVWKRSFLFDNYYQNLMFAFLMENRFSTKYQENFELGENGSLVLREIDLRHDGFYSCIYGDGITNGMNKYKVVTYVKPVPAYPAVEGCNFQRYCKLEVQQKGNLTCTMTGLRPEIRLEWKVSNEASSGKISFFDHTSKVTKSGETFNITLTSSYSITSVKQITVECGVSGSVRDVFPENSVVNLLLVPAPVKPTDDSNVAVITFAVSSISVVAVLSICGLLFLKAHRNEHRNKKKQKRKSLTHSPLMAIPKFSRSVRRYDIRVLKKRLENQLKQTYKRLYNAAHPIPFIRDRLAGINTVFIEGCVEKLASPGKIEKHHEGFQDHGPSKKGESVWVKLDSYSDMVQHTLRNSSRLILEGEPGYGKSTITLQMAYDWCSGMSYLEDVEIFILLRLRQLGGVQSIYEAMQHFILPFNSQITETDLQYILAHSESLMIVLDGYDEYPVNDRDRQNFLSDILVGEMFQNARVILTTSPSVLPNDCAPQTQRIRLTGFDDKARDEYIRKAVVGDDETAVENIKQCIIENSIVNDLCQAPFFFTIAVHMCQESESLKNLKTVTEFFGLMLSCFLKENKINLKQRESSAKALDILNKEAFESLNVNSQQRNWQSEKLLERLGQDLYDQFVSAGILVEEEACDISGNHSSLECTHLRKVMTVRFYHHLFCEWYAANYLVKMISKLTRLSKRSSGLGSAYCYSPIIKKGSKPEDTRVKDIESLLNEIKPFHLKYIYHFVCGLDRDCAVTIAEYLQDKRYHKYFIILCVMEQTENIESILENVASLCSTDIFILVTNTLLQQKSTIELLNIASNNKIPISKVRLIDSFKKVNFPNESIQLQSELQLPPLTTLKEIEIGMKEEKLTEKEFEEILKYLSKCPQLEKLSFSRCYLPDSFQLESLYNLKSGHIEVVWSHSDKVMSLNHQTGKWEFCPSPTTTSSTSTTDSLTASHSDRGNKSRRKSFTKKEELHDLQSMPTAFRYLSSQLSSDWRCIGRSLGIQDSKLDHLNADNACTQERNYLMFIHWKELNGTKASYVNLRKALEEAGRRDLAEDLKNLKKRRQVSPSSRTSHSFRFKLTDQTGQSREETTWKQRRKFREESMELTLHYLSRNLGKEWLEVGRSLLLSEA